MSAISIVSESEASRTMQGISPSPASIAARYRRSPAMIWKRGPRGRTRIGSSTPFSRTDAISSERSPRCWRGWFGFGSMSSIGTMRPTGSPPGRPSWSTKWRSCRMRSVSGNPIRRGLDTFDDLLAQAVVLVGSRGLRREGEDRLLVRRALLEPDALGDRGAEHAVPEDAADRLLHVARERRALVVERDHRAQQLQVRVRTRADLLHRLQQVVRAL